MNWGAEHGNPFAPGRCFRRGVPQDASGKIVHRAMAAAYAGENPGDLSSIENPETLEALYEACRT